MPVSNTLSISGYPNDETVRCLARALPSASAATGVY